MAQQGDDCYYFYYSTCAKGASCPFRHCEAALGNEVTCSLWEQGVCYRAVCTYRHMHITKDRSKIQCYWETQPSGCLKPHCVFHHLKPRPMEAGFGGPTPTASEISAAVPPPVARAVMPPVEEPAGVGSPAHVPTPQVAPVVINPFEEAHSSDESSEHGSPRKQPTTGAALRGVVLSTRKIVSSENEEMEGTQHEVGGVKVKTLQEIRRERMGSQPTGGQNFTQQSPTRQVQVKSLAEIRKQKLMNRLGNKSQQQRVQGDLEDEGQEEMSEDIEHVEIKSLAEIRKQKLLSRLGNKSQQQAAQGDLEGESQEGTQEGLGIKSLADIKREKLMNRLGGVYQKGAENEEQKGHPQVQVKSLADIRREKLQRRLGKAPQESDMPTGEDSITQVQEQGQIKVKTLEEIKRAKLLSRLGTVPEESVQSIAEHDDKLEKQAPVGIKTLEEIKREKLLRRLGKFQEKREQHKDEIITEKSEVDVQSKEAGSIQIKTLAEIRREKAFRNLGGATQAAKDDNGSTVDTKKQVSPKKLPVSKPDPQAPGGVKKTKGVRRVVVVDPHKVVEKVNTAAGRKSPDAAEKRSNNVVTNRRGVKREMQLYRPPRGKDTGPSLAEKSETSPTKLAVKTTEQKAAVPSRAVEKVQLSRKSPEKAQVLGKSPEKAQQNVPEVKAPEQIKIKTFEEIMREKKLRKQQEETEEPAGKTPEVSPKLARKSSVPSQPLSDSTKGEQPAKKVKLGLSPVKVQPQEPTIVKRGIKRPLATGVPTTANVVPVSVGQAAPKKPAVIVPSLSEKTTPSDILTGDGQALLEEAFAAKKPKIIRAQSPTIPQKTPPPTTPKLQETPTTTQEPPVVTKPAESNTTTSQKPPATDRQESVDLEDFEFDLEGDETDLTALGDDDDDSLMAELDEMLNS